MKSMSKSNVFKRILNAVSGNNSDEIEVKTGSVVSIDSSKREIRLNTTKVESILDTINETTSPFTAVDAIVQNTPDGMTALHTYIHFANRGGHFEFYNSSTGKRVKKYDKEFREVCASLGKNNSAGLDGLNDQMIVSDVTRTGIAFEVIVKSDLSGIEDVVLLDPSTIDRFSYIDSEYRYALYQRRTDGKTVDLYSGNFIYIPNQPLAGSPLGTLQFAPAIPTMTQYYQLLVDENIVMNRIARPRYNYSIKEEAVLNSMPAEIKGNAEKKSEYFQKVFNDVKAKSASISLTSDIVHFDSIDVDTVGGGVNGSGIDIRAWMETYSPLISNAFGVPLVLLNRQQGGSYALSEVEKQAFMEKVETKTAHLKRANEYIANVWARTMGYAVTAVFIPAPIDWEAQKDKWEAKLLQQQYYRKSEEYKWIDKTTAASDGAEVEAPVVEVDEKERYEYLRYFPDETSTSTTNTGTTETGGATE